MAYRNKKTKLLQESMEAHMKASFSPEEAFAFAHHDAADAERGGYSNYSYWRSTFQAFKKNKVAVFFVFVVVILLLFTFIQPILPNQKDPLLIYEDAGGERLSNLSPNGEFWFGTDSIGRDMWSRIWSATRTSLFIGFAVAGVEIVLGILVGVLWGYVRKLDFLFTELYNVFDNIPQTILLILISYIMRPSISTLIFAMCLTSWLQMARFVRNQILIIRDRDYNLASRCLGTTTFRIIFRNLLPYLVSVIMLRIALTIPSAISNEVFITYIGLGVPTYTPSLGNLINEGRKLMMDPALRYQLIFPTVVLSIVTISFYIVGNAFADAADPKNHR